MKIGIRADTLDKSGYGRWGENTYQKLKEHGYECSYFNMADTNSLIYTLSQKESDEFLAREKSLADRAGIEIEQVHGPWRWPPQDLTEEDRAERMEKMKKSIRATALLGCKNWVIHPMIPYGIQDQGTPYAEKTREINLEFFKNLLKTAKEYNVTVCLENLPMKEFSLSKPVEVLKLVEELNDENCKMCLDTGHVNVFDDLDLAEETQRIGKKLQTLHVHDNVANADFHFMPYFGSIDWKDFIVALQKIGYKGSFMLETCPPKKMPNSLFDDACRLLAKIAKEISG